MRETFDQHNLISALHSFMSTNNKDYKNLLPPLSLLTNEKERELLTKLEGLNFLPHKNIAA